MSLYKDLPVPCPSCGKEADQAVNFSVNADRRPDLVDEILDGGFQRLTCPHCDTEFRLEPELTYLHAEAGQWILVKPAGEIDQWADMERIADVLFEANYGAGASRGARELGASLSPRVTFGWPALREKVVCKNEGIDDVVLELLKMALLRTDKAPPISDAVELRLYGVYGDELRLGWIDAGTEEVHQTLDLPRQAYDDIAAHPERWEALSGELTEGAYVDMNRLLVASA